MKKNKSKKVNLETAMLIGLNAFAVGMFLQKVLICGISWMSTIGYLKQEEKMDEKTEKQRWKEELKKEMREKRKKPNGFQYFSLGFSVCALLVAIITKLQQKRLLQQQKQLMRVCQ